ncbi:MAG: alpha-glucosidase, partial [Candidatus Lokiarchaeota archaeon]
YNSAIEVVKNISDYFGRQPKIPNWVYDGIILGIQGGNEIVEKKISIALEADIPVNAVWCQDWQGIRMTSLGQQLFWNWIYDKKLYPDLPKFIKNLHKQNIKFLGYICALLNIEGDQYKEAEKNGYLLKDKSGTPITIRSSDFLVGIVDFSNRDATQWFKNIIKNEMIKIGLDGWMTDYGEYCVTNASIELDLEGANFHNYYPVLYAKSVYEVLKETNTLSELFVFHRTGYNESIPYMMSYWAGDQLVNWDKELGLPSVIPCGLSIGLGGVGNYHFDIGGFTTYREFKREKETFIRWVELGAFSLIMRTHEGNMPSKNWQFDSDEETLHHLSKMVKIHVILKPYIKSLEEEYQELGIPPMRPCFLHYEQDQTLNNLKFQYLFGRDLLVAPVIKPDKQTWKVYLPEDDWIHIWTEKEYKSGWLEIESPLGEPPVFYRKESLFRNIFRSVFHLHYSYSNPE